MGFIAGLFSRLREPSTWGAVSALALCVGASQEHLDLSAHTVAVGAALLCVLLPDAPKSDQRPFRGTCPPSRIRPISAAGPSCRGRWRPRPR